MDLHRFWDGVITSSSNLTRLRNEATALRNRQEFQRSPLIELAHTDFGSWLKRASRLGRRLLTVTVGGLGFHGGWESGLHDGHSGSRASCGLRWHCE